MKNLIENLRNKSTMLRNVEGENETTLMLDQAADAIAVFEQNQITSEISALGDVAHTVLVYREIATGAVQTAYLDAAQQFEDRAVYEHIATINPKLWIKAHFDQVYHWRGNPRSLGRGGCQHPKECEPLDTIERLKALREAAQMALSYHCWREFGECRVSDYPIPTPSEVEQALKEALK